MRHTLQKTAQWCATHSAKVLQWWAWTAVWWDGYSADTLVWELKISIILVATNLLHLLQIRKNGQSKVQNFASEIDIKK